MVEEILESFQAVLFQKVDALVQDHGHQAEDNNGHEYHVKLEEAGSATDRNVDAKRGWIVR